VKKGAGKTVPGAYQPKAGRKARSDRSGGQEKPLSEEDTAPVPQTDTGRQVEKTKAHGKTLVKELGNIAA
jgi:hypothetical protein